MWNKSYSALYKLYSVWKYFLQNSWFIFYGTFIKSISKTTRIEKSFMFILKNRTNSVFCIGVGRISVFNELNSKIGSNFWSVISFFINHEHQWKKNNLDPFSYILYNNYIPRWIKYFHLSFRLHEKEKMLFLF